MSSLDLTFLDRVCSIENSALGNIEADKLFLDKSIDLSVTQIKKFIIYYNEERKRRYGYEGILPAEYTHEYSNISKDWKRKLITIGVEGDIVISILKRVQMFENVYTRLEGLPISISGSKQNEKSVLDNLTPELCYKINAIEPEAAILEAWGYTLSEKQDNYNFYCDVPTHSLKIGSSKWRNKKGINKLNKITELTWEIVTKPSRAIIDIQKGFDEYKGEGKGANPNRASWHSLAKNIAEFKSFGSDSVLFYLFSYNKNPIGLCVYVIVNKKWAHQIVKKSAHSTEVPEVLNKKFGSYIHYVTITDLNSRGITDVYLGGSFDIGELKTHKKEMSDAAINTLVYKK
jgi:hypothetical protein